MSTEFEFGDESESDVKQAFVAELEETFAPWVKSHQYKHDHPDGQPPPPAADGRPPVPDSHYDGDQIRKSFGLEPLHKFLHRAVEQEHAAGKFPQALAHFLTHIEQWELWEIKADDPKLDEVEGYDRRQLFEWYAALDVEAGKPREKAVSRRTKRLRDGGTGIILHGEQGTTKTTGMYWLVAMLMSINRRENVIWQSTLDDTEWQVFGPWATMFLPSGVDVRVTVNPYGRKYRDLDPFTVPPEAVCRQVIRYDEPDHILEIMADRNPGHFNVVYPDPYFRQCQALTGYSYESMWDVESSDEATKLNHFWFGLMEALHNVPEYNYWTTIVGDEAHKWLRHGKGNDEHDWWNKIEQWATYWGDARKERLSVLLAIHKWHELDSKVRDKVRWGATMNGESFPPPAPIDGKNIHDQDLGDFCVWNNINWNHVGYPNIKRKFSVPGDISVEYPGLKAEKRAKS